MNEEAVEEKEVTGQECPGYEKLPQWVFLNLDLTFRRKKVGFVFLRVQDALMFQLTKQILLLCQPLEQKLVSNKALVAISRKEKRT